MNINELLTDTSKLDATTLPELKTLVEKYPFFQVARVLYVFNLYQQHDPSFGTELKKASVFVPDRTALFKMTEGVNYELPKMEGSTNDIDTTEGGNRTLSLINTYLNTGIAEPVEAANRTEQQSMPTVANLTNDYASFLLQQDSQKENNEEVHEEDDAPKMKGGDLIDSFIEETKGKQRLDMLGGEEAEKTEGFTSPEFTLEEEEVYTESMVNIYIQQGRYQQALEILRRISLNNPKKSSNFAAQIHLLEIILRENAQNTRS